MNMGAILRSCYYLGVDKVLAVHENRSVCLSIERETNSFMNGYRFTSHVEKPTPETKGNTLIPNVCKTMFIKLVKI